MKMILKFVNKKQDLTVDELVELLKIEVQNIHINDIMRACAFLTEEGKFVHKSYREKFYESYIRSFILRVKEIKEDKKIYNRGVDLEELNKSLIQLEEQEMVLMENYSQDSNFLKIYQIISIYTTFVIDEPIHIVGTVFPGNFKVRYVDGKYLCPVKEKQKDNPNAVCGFCIAEQDPDAQTN